MSGLAAKYDYLEKFTQKVRQTQEPKKRDYVPFRGGGGSESGPPKKKQKKKQKPTEGNNPAKLAPKSIQKPSQKQSNTAVRDSNQNKAQCEKEVNGQQMTGGAKSEEQFNAVDILRKRLHQRIEESRGQGPPKDPFSEEVRKKRERRRQERDRKKKKRKEFLSKRSAKDASVDPEGDAAEEKKTLETPSPPSVASAGKEQSSCIVFNKVEVADDYVDKGSKLREKKQRRKVKSTLTPLTGRNYKQLLSRVEARKARIEELREKDEAKAKKEEEKMRWSNVLYKAEGMKIKDDEQLLRASLKRKEKRKEQRKKKWSQRSLHVVEKMQQRQDKRRRNLQKRKQNKVEKKKERARKKGRVLPEDLKKAAV